MAREKSPAYQWYVKDWRSSAATMRMSMSQRGVYREMLDQQWEDGSLPDDAQGVADLIATSDGQVAEVLEAWPVVRRKFVSREDGTILNARLEQARRAWRRFRNEKVKAGKSRAAQGIRDEKGRLQSVTSTSPADVQHESSTSPAPIQPSSVFAFASSSASASTPPPDARSKRPIHSGQRLTVFEWMFDDHCKILGAHTDSFDLSTWYWDLDARMVRDNLVMPPRDGGAWLQAELVAEAQRRGLPIRFAMAPQAGKLTTRLASAVANIAREA